MDKLNIKPAREMLLVKDADHDRMVSVDHKAFYDSLVPEGFYMCEYTEFVRCPNPDLDGLKVINHISDARWMKDITDPAVWVKLMNDSEFLIYPADTSYYGVNTEIRTMNVRVSNPIKMSLIHQIDPSILYIKPYDAIRLGIDADGDILSLGITTLSKTLDPSSIPDDLNVVCEAICEEMISNPDVKPIYTGIGNNNHNRIVFTYKGEYREFRFMTYEFISAYHYDDMEDFIK